MKISQVFDLELLQEKTEVVHELLRQSIFDFVPHCSKIKANNNEMLYIEKNVSERGKQRTYETFSLEDRDSRNKFENSPQNEHSNSSPLTTALNSGIH